MEARRCPREGALVPLHLPAVCSGMGLAAIALFNAVFAEVRPRMVHATASVITLGALHGVTINKLGTAKPTT